MADVLGHLQSALVLAFLVPDGVVDDVDEAAAHLNPELGLVPPAGLPLRTRNSSFIIPEGREEPEVARRIPGSVLWGLLLVLVGCYLLWRTFWGEVIGRFLPGWVAAWNVAWGIVRGSAVAILLIGLGLLLVLGFSRRGEGAPILARSRQERVLAGVCGGLGRYFRVDSVWVRLGWVLLTLASFWAGVLAYLAAALLIPEEKS